MAYLYGRFFCLSSRPVWLKSARRQYTRRTKHRHARRNWCFFFQKLYSTPVVRQIKLPFVSNATTSSVCALFVCFDRRSAGARLADGKLDGHDRQRIRAKRRKTNTANVTCPEITLEYSVVLHAWYDRSSTDFVSNTHDRRNAEIACKYAFIPIRSCDRSKTVGLKKFENFLKQTSQRLIRSKRVGPKCFVGSF